MMMKKKKRKEEAEGYMEGEPKVCGRCANPDEDSLNEMSEKAIKKHRLYTKYLCNDCLEEVIKGIVGIV
jgi:ribosomal protein L34E